MTKFILSLIVLAGISTVAVAEDKAAATTETATAVVVEGDAKAVEQVVDAAVTAEKK